MGLFTGLRLAAIANAQQATAPINRSVRLASPWATGELERIVAADMYGLAELPMTRAEAVSIPPVARARQLICPTLARHPLVAQDAGGVKIEGALPTWLTATTGPYAPQWRMLSTLDDLFFTAYSLWLRDAPGAACSWAEHCPLDAWDLTDDGWIEHLGVRLDPDQYLLFLSPQDPFLTMAARTLRGYRKIEEAWIERVQDPIPIIQLKQTEDVELIVDTDTGKDEADEIIETYLAARRRRGRGSIVFVPHGYDLEPVGDGKVEPGLFTDGRNAAAIDVARFAGLPATLLDAAQTQASLRYSTTESQRSEFHDYSLAMWAMAIESRLSMDDVVAPGISVHFDQTWLMTNPTPPTGPTLED